MGLWDQSAYKQNVVRSYAGWMKLAMPLYNATAPCLMRPLALPRPGEKIRNAYAAFVAVAWKDRRDRVQGPAGRYDANAPPHAVWIISSWGSMMRDPLLAYRAASIRTFFIKAGCIWPNGPTEATCMLDLTDRPSYVEIATL